MANDLRLRRHGFVTGEADETAGIPLASTSVRDGVTDEARCRDCHLRSSATEHVQRPALPRHTNRPPLHGSVGTPESACTHDEVEHRIHPIAGQTPDALDEARRAGARGSATTGGGPI
jgi:hypothetical protein